MLRRTEVMGLSLSHQQLDNTGALGLLLLLGYLSGKPEWPKQAVLAPSALCDCWIPEVSSLIRASEAG